MEKDRSGVPEDAQLVFRGGNVRILVVDCYDHEYVGYVSADAMCRASKVWEKFIYPPWRVDSKPKISRNGSNDDVVGSGGIQEVIPPFTLFDNREARVRLKEKHVRRRAGLKVERIFLAEIDFSEDDYAGLLILLRIVHLQFQDVPPHLSTSELFSVAKLCDMYDCVELVGPFLSQWLSSYHVGKEHEGTRNYKWVFIALIFGRQKLFEHIARVLVREIRIDPQGNSVEVSGVRVEEEMHGVFGMLEKLILGLYYLKS